MSTPAYAIACLRDVDLGDVIVIEFPDRESARGWYDSAAYQAILPLRTGHSNGIAAIVGGVPKGYQATDGLAAMLPSAG